MLTVRRPRQPSPAAAEDPSSDPFLVSRPTGKPPRRRHPSSTTQPLSIPPAPAPAPTPTKPLSRSVPLPRHRPTKRTLLPPFEFPICDDLTDAGDLSDAAPTTPTRTRTKRPANPKSLPQFTPTPTKHVRPQRNHRRAPSDSLMVFHMSSDESGPESSGPSSSRSTSDDEALRTLLKNLAVQRKDIMKTPPPQRQREREAALEQQALQQQGQQGQGQAYFASSLFQNSPSPDELPDPMLF
ncbi:hypothetical protein DXG03_003327 [Asterophora parasitica]|uniref:Uncharacterized protein n=1 Tax=Asterophora parasitica TaxID=117018 RepID=A0A9P7G3R4_9AGAR|nr:hypothetical protein DXG03_003327 [Asterophora parasitica]